MTATVFRVHFGFSSIQASRRSWLGGVSVPEHFVDANHSVHLHSPGGSELRTELAVLKLDAIHIRNLLTGENANKQGALAISVNGQPTTLSWATDQAGRLKNSVESNNKFARHLLYFGRHKDLLDITVQVMVTHDDVVRKLTEAKGFLGMGAAVASLFPGAGTAVSMGLDILGAIVDFVRAGIHDNLELYAGSSIGKLGSQDNNFAALTPGQYTVSRVGGNRAPADIEVVFSVWPFHAPTNKEVRQAVIVLDAIKMKLPEELEGRMLVFDSTFGSEKNAARFTFEALVRDGTARIDDVTGLINKPVYYGPWTGGVPFSLALTGLRKPEELAALDGIAGKGGAFAKSFTARNEVQTEIDNATKAVQSVRALITEFLPDKLSVGTMSGFVVDAQSVPEELLKLENFRPIEGLNQADWCPFKLILHSESGGSAEFSFKIKEV